MCTVLIVEVSLLRWEGGGGRRERGGGWVGGVRGMLGLEGGRVEICFREGFDSRGEMGSLGVV